MDICLKKNKKENIAIYLLILLGTLVFWIPYMTKGFIPGAEVDFHYARVETLSQCIKEGIFPAKIRPMHMKGYGYGIGFFYPDVFLYIPAVLLVFGADYAIVLKIYMFIVTLIGGVAFYQCAVRLTGRKDLALLGEILFMESVINDVNVFVGGGLPHLFAYMALPLGFFGLFSALKREKKGILLYIISVVTVLLAHAIIFMTLMLGLGIILLFHVKVIKKDIGILKGLILASVVGAFITTAFWLPALEQMLHTWFKTFHGNYYIVSEHVLTLKELFTQHLGILLSVVFLFCVVVYFVLLFKKKKMPLEVTGTLFVTVFYIWFCTSSLIWKGFLGRKMNFFEYTDRFDFVITVTMILFIMMVLKELEVKELSGIAFVAASVVLIFASRLLVRPDLFTSFKGEKMELSADLLEKDFMVSGAEWLPSETNMMLCNTPTTAFADDGTPAEGEKLRSDSWFGVTLDGSKNYYDMPYIYYYGYRAFVLNENGEVDHELEVKQAVDGNGLVRVFIPREDTGALKVVVTYKVTPLQIISYIVTMLALVVAAILVSYTINGCVKCSEKNKR